MQRLDLQSARSRPCRRRSVRAASYALPAFLAGTLVGSAAFGEAAKVTVDPALPAYQAKPVQVPTGVSYVQADGAIRINGAEHALFIVDAFDALFTKTHPGFKFAPDLKGTSTAIPMLTHGVSPFVPMGRGVSPIELVPYPKIVGDKPLEIRVAHTAFVSKKLATALGVYVNQANPLSKISMEEVARIFTKGTAKTDISRWGQIGDTGEWAKTIIHPVMTPEYTGFGSYMERAHFHNLPFTPTLEKLPNTTEILKRVGEDPLAIGIAASGRTDSGVKMLALADKPGGYYSSGSPEDITADKYPLGRYLYFYIRHEPGKALDPFVKEYFRLILSKEGQEIIASEPDGYTPLTAAQAAEELAKLEVVK